MEQTQQQIKTILAKYSQRIEQIDPALCSKNPWNPNKQSAVAYASLKKSIDKYGWLQFPVVRDWDGVYQIIDGEHRLRAASELGLSLVRCLILGDSTNQVSEADAMTLTQLLNTRGQDDVLKRAELLKKLKDSNQGDLLGMMSMTAKEIESELSLLSFDFAQFDKMGVDVDEQTRAQKVLDVALTLEKETRKLHSESNNTEFRVLLEQYFEWVRILKAKLANDI